MGTIRISRYREEALEGTYSNKKASGLGFIAAVLLHIGLLVLMVFIQQHIPVNKKLPPSFKVDLVSYSPKLEDLLKSEKKQPKKITTKKPDKRLKPKPVKKLIQKSVKKKEKVFSEKKTSKPAKVIKAVEEEPIKKVEEPEPNKIQDLLAEMREIVAEQEMQDEDDYEEEVQASGPRVWSKGDHTASEIYHGLLAATIQQNWVFNDKLAKLSKFAKNENNLEVRVVIKIMRNGGLGDIWTETKSGNDFLDKSAVRAIKKSAPFPPLPKEFQRSSYEIGLRFSPKGLK